MKRILTILLMGIAFASYGQADINRTVKTPATGSNQNKTAVRDANLTAVYNLRMPSWSSFNLFNAKPDSAGYIGYQNVIKRAAIWSGNKFDTLAFTQDLANYMTITDGLKRLDSITVSGLTVTAYAPIQWRINAVNYQKLTNSVFSIPATTDGYNRIDLLYATTSNTVLRLQGTETMGVAVEPVPPVNTIKVSAIFITGSTISPPFPDLTDYLTKSEATLLYPTFNYLTSNYYTSSQSDSKYIYASPNTPQSASIDITDNATIGSNLSVGNNATIERTLFTSDIRSLTGENLTLYTANNLYLNLSGGSKLIVGDATEGAVADFRTTVNLIKIPTTATGTNYSLVRDSVSGEIKQQMITGGGGGSGTVTSVSSANGDISVATGTTTPLLTLNSGTGANQIVKRDGSGNIADLSGYALLNGNNTFNGIETITESAFPDYNTVVRSYNIQVNDIAGYFGRLSPAELLIQGNLSGSGFVLRGDNVTGALKTFQMPNVSGILALTSDLHSPVTIGTANGLSLAGQALSMALANGSVTGALNATDYNTFNNKQPQLNGTGFVKASGTTISYDNSTYLTTTAAAAGYVDLTTNQNVGGTKTMTANNFYIDGSVGTQKMFGFSGADTNPNFKGVYDFDGGYSGFQSGTNKGVQVFGYWGVTIQGNTQQATPNTLATITGATTDNSLTVLQTTSNAPIMEIKAASGISANYLNISTSAGTGNIFNINSSGNATLAGSLNGITFTNSGTKTLNLASGSSLITSGAFSTTLTSTANTTVTFPTTGTLYGTATGSITSAQLLASLSNETGTGVAVFGTSPTITTPNLTYAIANKTTTYTVVLTDYTLTGDATTASFTMTLPTAASSTGKIFSFKKIDSSANTVTIKGNGAELIDGTNTKVITTQYGGFTLQSNGTVWYIIL